MKLSLLTATVVLFSTTVSSAQTNIFPLDGNVGIGTTTPNSRLQVTGTLSAINLPNVFGSSSPVIYGSIGAAYSGWGVSLNHVVEGEGSNTYGMALLTSESYLTGRTEKMRITGDGNVGIGTTGPSSKLQVQGTLSAIGLASTLGASTPVIYGSINNGRYSDWGVSVNHVVEDEDSNNYGMALLTTDSYLTGRTEKMRIAANGNVGIGTKSPDSKLAVNGVVHAKEVKVDLNNWPDYVFKPEYNLRTLSEVRGYINQNNHLPELPSAAEVETKGLNLGVINQLLTKKVEELTLYLLEKDTEVNTLKSAVQSIEQKYKAQQNELDTIREMLKKLGEKEK